MGQGTGLVPGAFVRANANQEPIIAFATAEDSGAPLAHNHHSLQISAWWKNGDRHHNLEIPSYENKGVTQNWPIQFFGCPQIPIWIISSFYWT
jgi:hypothetical protein